MSTASAAPQPSPAAEAVREAIAAVGTVLFLDSQRREAIQRKAYNRDLNELVLTAERQFLWDALQRLQRHEFTGQQAVLSDMQAKHVERLDALRGSLCVGDATAARFLADLKAELQRRTRVCSSTAPAEAAA